MSARPPGAWSTVQTLAGVTLTRLRRGKALWIGAVIAALPVAYAYVAHAAGGEVSADGVFLFLRPLLALLPAMFVGASIGEEIEDRTSTYLWSRALERWAVLAGKLFALTPIVMVLIVTAWIIAIHALTGAAPTVLSCLALAAGCIVASLAAAGIATAVPKHAMALTIGYMLVDNFVSALPISLREISITYQTYALTQIGGGPVAIGAPVIALGVIGAVWGTVGFLRIRRIEA